MLVIHIDIVELFWELHFLSHCVLLTLVLVPLHSNKFHRDWFTYLKYMERRAQANI